MLLKRVVLQSGKWEVGVGSQILPANRSAAAAPCGGVLQTPVNKPVVPRSLGVRLWPQRARTPHAEQRPRPCGPRLHRAAGGGRGRHTCTFAVPQKETRR